MINFLSTLLLPPGFVVALARTGICNRFLLNSGVLGTPAVPFA
jgi:hypothetical protein